MNKALLTLKTAVEDLAITLGEEIDELWMNEGTELYDAFGKKYGPLAFSIYEDFRYTPDNPLRFDIYMISNRYLYW